MSFHDWPLIRRARLHRFGPITPSYPKTDNILKSLDFTFRYTVLVTPPIFILGFILRVIGPSQYSLSSASSAPSSSLPVVIGLGVSSLLMGLDARSTASAYSTRCLLDLNLVPKPQLFLGKTQHRHERHHSFGRLEDGRLHDDPAAWPDCRAIPDELYESAEVDGAGYFRKLFISPCR